MSIDINWLNLVLSLRSLAASIDEPVKFDKSDNLFVCDSSMSDEDSDGGVAIEPLELDTTTEIEIDESKPRVAEMPRWRVLLHNDDVNDMAYVVDSIVRITPLSAQMSYDCMMEAHLHGSTLLLTAHKELAELYQERFCTRRLRVTIQPDGW